MKPLQLVVRDLTVVFNRVPALHHLSLTLSAGQCVAVIGPNGAGKTTFLKTIAGLLRAESGRIEFTGDAKLQPTIAYLPQREAVDWDFPITVRGVVEMGCHQRLGWWRSFSAEDRAAVTDALRTMRLEPMADRQISALSGGQQQRVFLARSLVQKARVFLLDEPFAGLDKPSQDALGQIMKDLARAGNLIIASHHDLKNAADFFDHAVLLNGELIAAGPLSSTMTDENLRRAYDTEIISMHVR